MKRTISGLAIVALLAAGPMAVGQVAEVLDDSARNIEAQLEQIGPESPADQPSVEQPRLPKHWIGTMVGPVPPILQKHLKLDKNQAALVLDVVPDSPAAKAGLEKDDILLAAQGEAIAEAKDLVEAVRHSDGKELELLVIHNGDQKTIKVTPGERPKRLAQQLPNRMLDPRNGWQVMPQDREGLQRFMEQFQKGDWESFPPLGNMEFRALGPGIVLGEEEFDANALPNGSSVRVFKSGDGPAKVHVEKNGQSWEFEVDDQESLEGLPEDVRGMVEGMLNGGGRLQLDLKEIAPRMGNLRGELQSGREDIMQRLEEMEKRLEKFQEQFRSDSRNE